MPTLITVQGGLGRQAQDLQLRTTIKDTDGGDVAAPEPLVLDIRGRVRSNSV